MNTIPNFRGIWAVRPTVSFILNGWGYNQKTLGLDTGIESNSAINKFVSFPIQVGDNVGNAIKSWRKVVFGIDTVLGITEKNSMWGWGSRRNIWNGIETTSVSPVKVTTEDDWLDFSFAQAQSNLSTVLGIKTNGTLWTWGANNFGQLGLGDTIYRSSPVQIGAFDDWIAASTTSVFSTTSDSTFAHSVAIRGSGGSGSLWAWGNNVVGGLGIGTTANTSSPVQVGSLNTWKKVYACGLSTFAIRDNGSLWAWGNNIVGILGLGNTTSRSAPVQVGALTDWVKVRSTGGVLGGSTVGLRSNGTLWAWGDSSGTVSIFTIQQGFLGTNPALPNPTSPVQVGSQTDWSDFEIFDARNSDPTIMALKTNGTLWVWGSNYDGLLARAATVLAPFNQIGALSWTHIATAPISSFGIRSNGSLWAWGRNSAGILGRSTTFVPSPVSVGSLTGWIDVSVGEDHVLARRSTISGATSGSLWSWGDNISGQLGHNHRTDLSSPVQVGTATDWAFISTGYQFSAAIKTNGTLWMWGENNSGRLGLRDIIDRSIPVQVGSGTTGPWKKIDCTQNSAIGIQQNGTIWAWGSGSNGRLGLGNTINYSSPVQIGSLTGWENVACGEDHVIARRNDGTLWGWGRNTEGQLGLGFSTWDMSSPVQIGANTDWLKINASSRTSSAIKTDNTLWGWGRNDYSAIDNSSTKRSSPVQIGTSAGWTAAALGQGHLIALTITGTMWSRGLASWGQLGVGEFPILVQGLTNPTQIPGITASSLAENTLRSCMKGFLKRM